MTKEQQPPAAVAVVDAIVELVARMTAPPERRSAEGEVNVRAGLAEILDAWQAEAPWRTPESRDSAYDRARRDPLFHALVQHLYSLMRQGEGQWTPTEIREAAMVAHMMIEQERPLRFLTPGGHPPEPPEPPPAPANRPVEGRW